MFLLLAPLLLTVARAAPNPSPFTPAGGLGTNTTPVYSPMSDFDFQSMNLALNQEWIELDLFHHGLAQFSVEEFEAAGINAADRFLIEFMADQEVGHATMITNILGPTAAKPCNYTYPFTTVREFVDFCQKLTRFGESGVYGFLEHLDSRASAELLLQSITTEARQQMIFRQFEGLFPMPIWFTPGITQSMAWTLLSPYIISCPAENPHIVFQNFPALNIIFVAWISQLNTTYTPLFNLNGTSGSTLQPNGTIYGDGSNALVNGTVFIAVTDNNTFVTPFSLSEINQHIVAGPAIYMAG
ncbi:Stress response protein [Mycena sanguinolenta]|uniref:Stress response protein n=1 Tax=Mycena sanguinolenta TaxID=230812 RepID=A0A8H7D4H9_9AGAR|nr:Stress response protein [Mycena sanguinolenta]